MLSLHASNYFIPGLYKILGGEYPWSWITENNLLDLSMTSYINGWMGFLGNDMVSNLYSLLTSINVFMTFGAVAIQVGAIFLLLNRKLSKIQFLLFELLHLAIFIFSGIFFWKWIILNILLFMSISMMNKKLIKKLYQKKTFVVSFILILTSLLTFRPIKLAWFDSGITRRYRFIATNTEGENFIIRPEFWAPYDITFAQARFNFVEKKQYPIDTYGTISVTQKNGFNIFMELKNVEDSKILNYFNEHSLSSYDSLKKSRLENFVKQFVKNYNKNLDKKGGLRSWISLPYHIYQFPSNSTSNPGRIIKLQMKSALFTHKKGDLVKLYDHIIMKWFF